MSPWEKIYGARRRAIDRRLLASMEREIASTKVPPPVIDLTEGLCEHFNPPAKCQFCKASAWMEERKRIARAFGRPL